MMNRRDNNFVDALELMRGAVEASPDNREYLLDLAEMYCEMGCHEQSNRILLDMLSRNDAELACDESTIRRLGESERAAYGRTLISLTCEKHSALLITATTMTGSKKSIKERISLIVKRPKTALVTAIVILLVGAIAVGCTFTGAKSKDSKDDSSPDNISSDSNTASDDNSETIEPVEIKYELSGIPDAAVEYALDYVQAQIDYYNECGKIFPDKPYQIIDAKITKLESISTGTDALDQGIRMYLLEYRLLPDKGENVMLSGGMSFEGDWLTEHGSTGQPYLLLHYKETNSGTEWTRIAVTNTDAIMHDYSTAEMLDKYGNAYTAAAMELYGKLQSTANEPFDIAHIVNSIFVGYLSYDETWKPLGNYTLTAVDKNGRTDTSVVGLKTYYSISSTPGRYLTENYTFSPAEKPEGTPTFTFTNSNYSLAVYENGTIELSDGNESMVLHSPDGESIYNHFRAYALEILYNYEMSSCTVDGSENDYSVIAQRLSEQYAAAILDRPSWYHQRAQDAKAGSADVFDAYYGTDNPNFVFDMNLYLQIPDELTNYWQSGAGLSEPLTSGEFAGYYGYGGQVHVHKYSDGKWRITGISSGGAAADLPANPDTADTATLLDMYFLTGGFSHDMSIPFSLIQKPLDEVKEALDLLSDAQRQQIIDEIIHFIEQYPTYNINAWTSEDFR